MGSRREGPTVGHLTAAAPLRLVVLGTAGTGKSDTLRATVASVETLWGAGKIVRCAHTGVAAFNMGAGAETINSVFMLNQELRMTKTLDALVKRLSEVPLLIIDEVSMVGSKQFLAVSQRLEAVARTLWRKLRGPRAPSRKCRPRAGRARQLWWVRRGWRLACGRLRADPADRRVEPHSVPTRVA